MEAIQAIFPKAADGAIIVSSREGLPQAIRTAEQDATIQVPNETLLELGKIAAGPNRMNRTDIKFRVGEAKPNTTNDTFTDLQNLVSKGLKEGQITVSFEVGRGHNLTAKSSELATQLTAAINAYFATHDNGVVALVPDEACMPLFIARPSGAR